MKTKQFKLDLRTAAGLAVAYIVKAEGDNLAYAHIDFDDDSNVIGVAYGIKDEEGEMKKIEHTIQIIERACNDNQKLADFLCDIFPDHSRFQIHARVFKPEMRGSLPYYLSRKEIDK